MHTLLKETIEKSTWLGKDPDEIENSVFKIKFDRCFHMFENSIFKTEFSIFLGSFLTTIVNPLD